MSPTTRYGRGAAVVLGMAALLAACTDEGPLGIEGREFDGAIAASVVPDLGACDNLAAPAGARLVSHTYARGVQIYRWDGGAWVFVAPSAVLSADAGGMSKVGTHYAGPTWESNSGSKVVAAVIDRCTPDAGAIPWLSLGAVSAQGPGLFHRVSFIQRLNTTGGNAPAASGTVVGELTEVPYTAEYFFYRN